MRLDRAVEAAASVAGEEVAARWALLAQRTCARDGGAWRRDLRLWRRMDRVAAQAGVGAAARDDLLGPAVATLREEMIVVALGRARQAGALSSRAERWRRLVERTQGPGEDDRRFGRIDGLGRAAARLDRRGGSRSADLLKLRGAVLGDAWISRDGRREPLTLCTARIGRDGTLEIEGRIPSADLHVPVRAFHGEGHYPLRTTESPEEGPFVLDTGDSVLVGDLGPWDFSATRGEVVFTPTGDLDGEYWCHFEFDARGCLFGCSETKVRSEPFRVRPLMASPPGDG